ELLLFGFPSGSFRYGGPKARASSPVPGRSILITSAPRSPSICADKGPASTRVRSRILMPESGRADIRFPPELGWVAQPRPAQDQSSGYTIFGARALHPGHAGIHAAAQESRPGTPFWRQVAAAEISRPAKTSPGRPFRQRQLEGAFA